MEIPLLSVDALAEPACQPSSVFVEQGNGPETYFSADISRASPLSPGSDFLIVTYIRHLSAASDPPPLSPLLRAFDHFSALPAASSA